MPRGHRVVRPIVRQERAGFTLLELVIAMAVITTGVLATVALLTNSVASARAVRNEVVGVNLAQEALEIVQNIRDQNVAAGRAWNQGMVAGQTYRVDVLGADLLEPGANPPFNLDANGFYTYGAGTETFFRRTVAFAKYPPDPPLGAGCADPCPSLRVTVTVSWPARSFTADSVITEWR